MWFWCVVYHDHFDAIFAQHTNQQGPRLTDLMVQVSTYGTLIPVIYGQARIGGNVIWALPLQEGHLDQVRSASLELAAEEDPNE